MHPAPHCLSFQVTEMRRTLTPANSPVSSPSKHGDRFIPSRAGANWSVNFHRINVRAPEGRGQGGLARRTTNHSAVGQARPLQLTPILSLPLPQENEKSPSQNRKAKDATSDNGKGRESGPQTPLSSPTLPLTPARPSLLPCLVPADGLAYSALLKNELLGAGIEKVQDPQTEDRRLQPSTPEKKGLFTVSLPAVSTRLLPLGRHSCPQDCARLGLGSASCAVWPFLQAPSIGLPESLPHVSALLRP